MNVARSSTKTDLKAEDDLNRLRFMKLSWNVKIQLKKEIQMRDRLSQRG
jgi:hypothetical protein